MDDDSFPRGGTNRSASGGRNKKRSIEDEELFKSESRSSEGNKKRKVAVKVKGPVHGGKAGKKKQATGESMKSDRSLVHILSGKTVCAGVLVLGCVKDVECYHMIVAMPGGLTGKVPITNISDSYTASLQRLASTEETAAPEEVAALQDLFCVGDLVRCMVLQVPKGEKKGHLKVTINPKEVNQAYNISNLKDKMVLGGCVSSVEDHGYVVDLGMKGLTAFLPKEAASEHTWTEDSPRPLRVGSYVRCMVRSADSRGLQTGEVRTVSVTVAPREVERALATPTTGVTLLTLLPGTLVTGKVTKTSEDGVKIHFLSYYGTIQRAHLQADLSAYAVKQQITAAVLFIHPTTKAVALTQLTHLVTPDLAPKRPFGDLSVGDVIEEAEVVRFNRSVGVYLRLSDRVMALALNSQLGDKVPDLHKDFTKGSKHRCRILNFDLLESLAIVSLKESILGEQFLTYEDVQPGMVVKCEVTGLHQKGMSVKVTNRIKGFIPIIHLADIPLKHPEKKFQTGTKLKCRVLKVDPRSSKLTLTHKKSLVKSKMPIVTDYAQCRHGLRAEGFIASIKDSGVLVVFYNNVKGWVPRPELSSETIDFPEKVFYPGQVVSAMVLACYPNEKRLTLSFKVSGRRPFASKKITVPDDFQIGKLVNCKITKKSDKGLDVTLLPSKLPGFLPKMHLSDHRDNCELLFDMHQVGDVLKDVMYTGRTNVITLTRKASLLEAAGLDRLVQDFSQLKPDMLVTGSVKRIMSYGVFLELTNSLVGLVPNKYLSNQHLKEPGSAFYEGQSLQAKVMEVDDDKQHFLLSLRMSDCFHGDADSSLALLANALCEYKQVLKSLESGTGLKVKLSEMRIGQVAMTTITNIREQGVLCQLANGVKGFATMDHMTGVKCKKGDERECVVLYVDPKAVSVEVSYNEELVKAASHLKDNKFTQVKVNQVMKSEVHLIKEDFVLVSLKGHAAGRLAFLPARRHLNDLMERHMYVISQVNPVIIKRMDGDRVLASLQMHETSSADRHGRKSRKLLFGQVTAAKVLAVHQFQLNVDVHGAHGRVFISEIADDLQQGTNPLEPFKVDSEVTLKIIGFREVKSHNYLPISHPNLTKSLLECTLKSSKLDGTDSQTSEDIQHHTYQAGDRVQAFVSNVGQKCVWMIVNPLVKGKVELFNIPGITKNPGKHFKVGQGYMATVIGAGKGEVLDLSLKDRVESVQVGSTVEGRVTSIQPAHGLSIQLPQGYHGNATLVDLFDDFPDQPTGRFKEGQVVQCYILKQDQQHSTTFYVSLRASRVNPHKKSPVKDHEIDDLHQLRQGQILRGYVKTCSVKGVFVSLSRGVTGRAQLCHLSRNYILSPKDVFPAAKVVTVCVLSIDALVGHVDLSLLEEDTGVAECIPPQLIAGPRLEDGQQTHTSKTPTPPPTPVSAADGKKASKRTRRRSSSVSLLDDAEPTETDGSDRKKLKIGAPGKVQAEGKVKVKPKAKVKVKVKAESEVDSGVDLVKESDSDTEAAITDNLNVASAKGARLAVPAGFSWDNSFCLPATPGGQGESDSDDSETGGDAKSSKPKKTKRQRKQESEEEEKRLYERERSLLESDRSPETADEFDRLVLQSPDSSLVWLRYMAFHLETTEIEKARAVAERALKTISFREEQEKLNVWVGHLNLENLYGSPEILQEVFDRAIKHNDPLKVFQQLVNIYVKSGKTEAAEQLYSTMVKRFSLNKDVWVGCGLLYYKNDKADQARKLLQRSLRSLDKKDHVATITKFAQMEFKFAEAERGKTMFENVLSSYPKRTDLWSVYIDMVIGQGQLEPARYLLERVIHLNLSAKKMKVFFKKYLDFEERHGTEETVKAVKVKAIEYVEEKAVNAAS